MSRLACIIVILICALSGCDTEYGSIPENYFFAADDVSLAVGGDADEAVRLLGEPNSHSSAESCAGGGFDELYIYNGFRLKGYREGETCLITSIELTNDTVSTAEGVFIGDGADKLEKVYGEGEAFSGGVFYLAKSCELRFFISEDRVVSIKYVRVGT